MPGLGDWMTLEQAAERFGLKRDRLKRAALEGRLAVEKPGGGRTSAYFVTEAAVRAFLASDKSRRGRKRRVDGPAGTSTGAG